MHCIGHSIKYSLAIGACALSSALCNAQVAQERARIDIPVWLAGVHLQSGSLVVGGGSSGSGLGSYDLSNPDAPGAPVAISEAVFFAIGDGPRVLSRTFAIDLSPTATWSVGGSVTDTGGIAHDLRGDLYIQRANDGTVSTFILRRQASGNWLHEQTLAGERPVAILAGERVVCAQGSLYRVFQRVKGIWFPTSVVPEGYAPEFRIGDDLFCREYQAGVTEWRILTDAPSGFVYGGFLPAPPTVAPWSNLTLSLNRNSTARSGSVLVVGCPSAGTVPATSCANCGSPTVIPHGAVLVYVRRPSLDYDFVGLIGNPDPWHLPQCQCYADNFGNYVAIQSDLLVIGSTAGPGGMPQLHVFTLGGDCDQNGASDLEELASGTASDYNDNGIPDSCECLADLNGDSVVGGADLAILLAFWGQVTTFPAADINRDGVVGGSDLTVLLSAWGACP